MGAEITCKLCGTQEIVNPHRATFNKTLLVCARCGTYWISRIAQVCEPTDAIRPHLHLLSGVCRHQWDSTHEPFVLTAALLSESDVFSREISSRVPSDIPGKARAVLRSVADRSEYPGHRVSLFPKNDYPLGFCKIADEFRFYLQHLQETGLLNIRNELAGMDGSLPVYLTAAGWDTLAGESGRRKSNQCFVAMWFDPSVEKAFTEGIKLIESDTGFTMLRIDMTEFNEKVCDKILAEIKSSRFMIADVTNHRHAVYFEAGFAMGLGLPVIWCCRKDEMGKCPNFDTRQYNHILWETPDELKDRLKARIAATIGKAAQQANSPCSEPTPWFPSR